MAVTGRIWTVPNAVSASRFVMVAAFGWLIATRHDFLALCVLALASFSDWVDGVLARRLNQTSELGSLLDPAADRAFIIVGVVCLAWRGIIPWWLLAALLAREVVMGITLLARRRAGLGPMAVEFLGKAATLALMYAFPLLLIASLDWWIGDVAWVLGWACSLWGLGLYWVVCVVYVLESRDEIREAGVGEGVTACVTQATSERGAVT